MLFINDVDPYQRHRKVDAYHSGKKFVLLLIITTLLGKLSMLLMLTTMVGKSSLLLIFTRGLERY